MGRGEVADVVDHREAKRLVGGQLLGGTTTRPARRDQERCPQNRCEGTENGALRHTTSYETRLRGRRQAATHLDFHRPLPGKPGRECAGDGSLPSGDGPATPRSSLRLGPSCVKLRRRTTVWVVEL